MNQQAVELIQSLPDEILSAFASRLTTWLIAAAKPSGDELPSFSEPRARALLRTNGLLDGETLKRFGQHVEEPAALRVALYDILAGTGLAELPDWRGDRRPLAAEADERSRESDHPFSSSPFHPLLLVLAVHAWRAGYPLGRLDPASPPGRYSPAGQVLQRAAQTIREQIERTPAERERLSRVLAYRSTHLDGAAGEPPIAPLPPHFRPPVPVRYPEVARETLHLTPEELPEQPSITRGEPITISEEDVADAQRPAQRVRLTPEDARPRRPTRRHPARHRVSEVSNTLASAVRQLFAREPMKTTRLRVEVRREPDGPGLYGLQVRVRCRGVNSFVAGTTNHDGVFVCELPVPEEEGLTYNVDLTWPRDVGGEVERKSITLNADRTEFVLPFYRRLNIQ